jgi:2,5-furandicarboxylate decarboxylase 1
MVYDLRGVLNKVKERNELVEINKEVSPDYEIAGVIIASNKLQKIPALLFNNVKGYPDVRIVANFFAEEDRRLDILNLPKEPVALKERIIDAYKNPVKPSIKSDGVCKENVITEDIDLTKLFPALLAELRQKGRYFQPCIVSKDPDTGIVNVGMYRTMVVGPDLVVTNIRERENHGGIHYAKAKEKGEPFEYAICLGAEPILNISAATKLPYGYNEFEFASALMGRPIDLVKCETIDLEVPANSEAVIECVIEPPYEEMVEGPWPEYLRYLSPPRSRPIAKVKAVTFRNDPIMYYVIPGTKDNYAFRMFNEALLYKILKEFASDFVVDVRTTPGSAHWHHVIIKVRKTHLHLEGMQINVALAAFNWAPYLDTIILVDEDIDIYDMEDVEWAICTRCNPKDQIHILPEGRSHTNNPIAGVRDEYVKSKMIIDATIPWKYRSKEKIPGVPFFDTNKYMQVDLKDYI